MLLNACSNSSVCKMFWGAEKAPLKCDKTELQNWRNVSNCIFPLRFLLSSVNDHPFSFHQQYIPKPALSPDAPHHTYISSVFCYYYLPGRIKRRKDADQVPYISCRSWWKVSLNETHSGQDPSVIMLRTWSEENEVVPVPVTSLFFLSL